MSHIALQVVQWFLLIASVFSILRIILGPGAADRLVGLNVLSGLVLAFLVIRSVDSGRLLYLDVALVYDVFGFLGLLAIARFLRDRMGDDGEGGQ